LELENGLLCEGSYVKILILSFYPFFLHTLKFISGSLVIDNAKNGTAKKFIGKYFV
jgi:hypothetical protein